MIVGPPLLALIGSLVATGRLAIVASASVAEGQAPLRYADRDAERVAAVLRELGGFDRVQQLRQPSAQALRDTLQRAEETAARDPGLEVVFYYSGHADERGLLLGAERFAFDELRARLERSQAAVRVAFLDACYSGIIVRPKGGKPAPGYAVDAVEPPRVRGAAIISASTASELAQESSDIEGSFFTHHMLSALRGAGDSDGNGLVTLAEAYQYAYGHTLAATLPSVWGPQHPSYEYRLSGTGDLVLTRLGQGRRALSFPAGQGRVYVVTGADGTVMGEVAPHAQRRVRLVLPPGRYRVVAREDRRTLVAEVELARSPGGDLLLEGAPFREVAPELAFAKGGRPAPRNELALDLALSGLGPGVINGTPELGLGYLRRGPSWALGPHLSYGATDGTLSGIPYALRRWALTVFLLRRVPLGFSEVQLGVGAGAVLIRERIASDAERLGAGPTGAAAAALELPLGRWMAARLLWSAGLELLRVGGSVAATPEIRSSLAAVFRL